MTLPSSLTTPFPYTTLFRSGRDGPARRHRRLVLRHRPLHRGTRPGGDDQGAGGAGGQEARLRGEIRTGGVQRGRSEEHTSELQSPCNLVCRLLLEKNKN